MNDVRSSSFPWIARIAVLGVVALIAIVRLRSHRDESGPEGVGTPSSVHCTSLFPNRFNAAPGTSQEITAYFSGGSGHLNLTWSASGGVFMTTTGREEQSVLGAQLYVDDFDDGNLDRNLWRSEVTTDTALTEKQGVLRAVLGNGNQDRVARLETSEVIDGDFGAQVTIRDVNASASRGAVALSFVMLHGHEAHIQAIGAPGLAALEANARDAEGTWRTSASAIYGGGPVNLRLVRVGSTVSCSFDRGSGPVPLGTFTDLSVGPGHLRLETWSLDGHPAVETELDNFGAGQNTIVSWQAPSDAVPGSSYAIKLSEGCEARAVIAKPSADH